MKNIAVIGCGQLGRRHIQGLGRSSQKIKVHVYDIAPESLDACKAFVADIATEIENLEFAFFDDLVLLGSAVPQYDLIIVASTAHQRPTHLAQLVGAAQSRHWLIEKPLSQSPEELDELTLVLPKNGVWINHYRRFTRWHQNLQIMLSSRKVKAVTFSGPDLGIGCNISHFVDLVNYWTSQVPRLVDTTGLDNEWHTAKRTGFQDIDGAIKITFSGGTTLSVVSNSALSKMTIEGTYDDGKKLFTIDEDEGTAVIDGEKGETSRLPFQSEITGLVFDEIDQTDNSALTSFATAAECYRPVIDALLTHWKGTSSGAGDKTVPLT